MWRKTFKDLPFHVTYLPTPVIIAVCITKIELLLHGMKKLIVIHSRSIAFSVLHHIIVMLLL